MNRSVNKKIFLSIALYFGMVMINTLGAMGYINGMNQQTVSNRYDTLVTPAGFAFSIWGLIYGLLLLTWIVALVKWKDGYYQKFTEETSVIFWRSCLLNILWIVVFSYEMIGLSTVIIFALLIDLMLILKKLLKIHQKGMILPPLSFGIYAGWIFIANFVNLSAYLVQLQFDYFGKDEVWFSLGLIAVALILSVLSSFYHKNAAFSLPIAWALFGTLSELRAMQSAQPLQNLLLVGIAVSLCQMIWRFFANGKCILPAKSAAKF